MGIFDNKRSSISRRELRSIFRKDKGIIPGTGGKRYYQKQRDILFNQRFGQQQYGSQIDKSDYRHVLRDLNLSKRAAKTPGERLALDREIKYLKKEGGKSL